MTNKTEKPDDFVFWFGDIPVLMSELDAWYPGFGDLPMTEAMTYMPVFLGMSPDPVPLEDMVIDYKMVKTPEPEDPEHDLWLIKKELEQEILDVSEEIKANKAKFTYYDKQEVFDRLHLKLEKIREQLVDASKKLAMISKLSDNSEEKSK